MTLQLSPSSSRLCNFSDGPLMYTYRMDRLTVHFGNADDSGSEHLFGGKGFSAEVMFFLRMFEYEE